MRFKHVDWKDLPVGARKAWLRMQRFPAYDLSITGGWEWFYHGKWQQKCYAVNRSGHFYVAET